MRPLKSGGSFLQDRMHPVVLSGTLYGDEKFPFEKESRNVGQDASWNIIDLENLDQQLGNPYRFEI